MQARLSSAARSDLHAIGHALTDDAGEHVALAILETIGYLETVPFFGRVGRVKTTRELAVRRFPYVIVYTMPKGKRVDVERVLHASECLPAD